MHKAGFVNIIGLPNVGKSTLLNALVGERLSIISTKAQTTRHRILGIINGEDYQIVFSDTPGFINQPAYKLQVSMNDFVHEAFEDGDVLLLVTDKYQTEEDQTHLIQLVEKSEVPVIVLINKIDLYKQEEAQKLIEYWQTKLPNARVMPISAEVKFGIEELKTALAAAMPESPAYYEKDQLTDRNMRFLVSEMVREKIFVQYQKEIPYSCEVFVEQYKESEEIDRIRCLIYVERESQKAIIIGNKGEAIKKVGIEARKAIEAFTNKKVHLELFVKVKDKWRNDELALKNFGYNE